jgi:hypothetical protein
MKQTHALIAFFLPYLPFKLMLSMLIGEIDEDGVVCVLLILDKRRKRPLDVVPVSSCVTTIRGTTAGLLLGTSILFLLKLNRKIPVIFGVLCS